MTPVFQGGEKTLEGVNEKPEFHLKWRGCPSACTGDDGYEFRRRYNPIILLYIFPLNVNKHPCHVHPCVSSGNHEKALNGIYSFFSDQNKFFSLIYPRYELEHVQPQTELQVVLLATVPEPLRGGAGQYPGPYAPVIEAIS